MKNDAFTFYTYLTYIYGFLNNCGCVMCLMHSLDILLYECAGDSVLV